MNYLYIDGGDFRQETKDPSDDDLRAVSEGDLDIIRCHNGVFQQLSVDIIEADPDEEDSEEELDQTWSRI